MNYFVFDMETDGLQDNTVSTPEIRVATKIHCVCVREYIGDKYRDFSMTDMQQIKDFFEQVGIILVGHNISRYDIPVLKMLIPGINITARLVDTLALSWYCFPNFLRHGLEEWGIILGIIKPQIDDWENLTIEQYIHRCSEDVKINCGVFDRQIVYLTKLYGDLGIQRIMGYLMFKMECAVEQEEMKWKLDIATTERNLAKLKEEELHRFKVLEVTMPKVTLYRIASRPKVMYKKNQTLSVHGEKWMALLKSMDLPEYHMGAIKVPTGEELGNPGSFPQLKAWLFSMGWVPENFDYKKDPETKALRAIPQLSNQDKTGICESIKKMYEAHPELENLEGLFVIRHRIGILQGFLDNRNHEGFLMAQIKGFTNTLRFQHTTIVNLPATPKPYWEMIRECLIAPDDDHLLCGSDMSSLEDTTKRHYMYYYDPEYVKEMMRPDFDAHLDIAMLGGMATVAESDAYKAIEIKKAKKEPLTPEEKELHARIKPVRGKAKKVNFAGIYGAGPPKLALTGGFSLQEAKVLHNIYWRRNWSVKRVAEGCKVKEVDEQLWLFNPISQLWYSLREEKDKFSTLNQSTGVYCFDTQVRNVRRRGVKLCGQFHDEFIFPLRKGEEEYYSKLLDEAIVDTNNELQLNLKLGISKDFGRSYAEIH